MSESTGSVYDRHPVLGELLEDSSPEGALLLIAALHGLYELKLEHMIGLPGDTEAECEEFATIFHEDVVAVLSLGSEVVSRVRQAVPDDIELGRLIQESGLNKNPILTINLGDPNGFVRPDFDEFRKRRSANKEEPSSIC